MSGIDSTSAGNARDERVAQRQRAREQQRGVVLSGSAGQERVHQGVAEVLEILPSSRHHRPQPLEPGVERLAGALHQPVGVEDESAAGLERVLALLVGRVARGAQSGASRAGP